MSPDDLDLDRELRQAFQAETAGVQPVPGAWDDLAARAAALPVRRRRWPLLAAAAAVVLLITGVAVATQSGDEDATPAADDLAESSTTVDQAERCVEILERGGTVEECQEPPQTTMTTEEPEVVLEFDGFQGLKFGDPADDVIDALTRLYGPPLEDRSGTANGQANFGACPGTTARTVRWGGIVVLFTDETGKPRFSGWSTRGEFARTSAGIGVGSTVAEVRAAYPQASISAEPFGPMFTYPPRRPAGVGSIDGDLTAVGDTGLVMSLSNHPCGE